LQGYRIALTTASDDPRSPAAHLRELEGEIFFYPVAQVLPPDNYHELDMALQRCRQGEIDWLLLATPRTVEAVAERMAHLGLSPGDFASVKLASYGAKTRLTLADLYPAWESTLPHFNTHQQVVEAMQLSPGNTVLLPVALHSRTDWESLIQATQAEVITPPAYRLLLGRGGDDLPALLWGGLIDAVAFMTENNVRHFVTRLKAEGGTLAMLDDVPVACLDPQTAAAAQAYGLHVRVVPADYTFAALADALAHFFSTHTIEAQ
jgi:uroporphyrinogen-III synthase